jgi:hypothetical protein
MNRPPESLTSPTTQTYGGLNRAYVFFNVRLFNGRLPPCLITMQRKKGSYGYFAPARFGRKDEITDEIALNPAHFDEGERETLSTLVHEMAHLWQQHFGKPSRNGYHNKEWGRMMKEIGLHPSSTGREGGKETGQRVSHYIVAGGAYDLAFEAYKAKHGLIDLFGDRWQETEAQKKTKAKKNGSKTPYVCPDCDLKAWAKPDAALICGDCEIALECEAA